MTPAGIRGVSYCFPSTVLTVDELGERGLLSSSPDLLRSFGFERVHVAEGSERDSLALRAAEAVLAEHDVDRASIDALILFGGLPEIDGAGDRRAAEPAAAATLPAGAAGNELIGLFRYPAGRLQYELGLTGAVAFAVGQLGCAGMMVSLRVARALIETGDARNVLCVGVDLLPEGAKREVVYNVLSDAASAVLVSAGWERLRPVAFRHVTKGYYWDSPIRRDEIVAAYFPTARNVIRRVLEDAGVGIDELELLVPDNVSRRSWEILADLLGISVDRVYLDNVPKRGHSISSDNLVNLKDALATRELPPQATVALFTFGFGANWSATVIEA